MEHIFERDHKAHLRSNSFVIRELNHISQNLPNYELPQPMNFLNNNNCGSNGCEGSGNSGTSTGRDEFFELRSILKMRPLASSSSSSIDGRSITSNNDNNHNLNGYSTITDFIQTTQTASQLTIMSQNMK